MRLRQFGPLAPPEGASDLGELLAPAYARLAAARPPSTLGVVAYTSSLAIVLSGDYVPTRSSSERVICGWMVVRAVLSAAKAAVDIEDGDPPRSFIARWHARCEVG